MIRVVTAGLWVAILLVATSMVALEMKVFSKSAGLSEAAKFPVETTVSDMVSVPILTEKGINGYVLARFAVAHRAGALGQLGSKLQDIVADEAFRAIYKSVAVDFQHARKADLASLTSEIAAGMGKRLGPEMVSEVLIKEFTFVSKQDARR